MQCARLKVVELGVLSLQTGAKMVTSVCLFPCGCTSLALDRKGIPLLVDLAKVPAGILHVIPSIVVVSSFRPDCVLPSMRLLGYATS